MIFQPFTILSFDTSTKEWSKRTFDTYPDWYNFVKSCFKFPGKYNFKNTEHWIQAAKKFQKDKRYTDYHPKSKEYKEFWLIERRKCTQGIIIDDYWISPDLYWFWNYTPIFDKVKMNTDFPEIWDGHYHYDLYYQLAWLEDIDGACVKARQKGISLYHVARLLRRVWFGTRATLKIVGFEEEYVLGEWGILQNYRDHLNEHTGWYRPFSPDETLNWEQKIEVTIGSLDKKKVTKGNKSRIKGATTKKNFSKAVGGAALEIYATEAGIYQNLKKVKGYVDPNIKLGGVKTGMFVAAGAVGELKDAEDLQEFILNPKAYSIKSVKDVFSGSGDDIGFFFPDEWNYIYKDEHSGQVVKCYDINGNSNIQQALDFLALEEERQKEKDESSYKLWKSQHPRTVQDAFDQRENNIFPTQLLKEQQLKLLKDKDIVVELHRDSKGKVYHKFSTDPPVYSIKPDPKKDNRGAVIIYEFPVDAPPFGLYVAGVDPIYNLDTETSKSLMAITIYMCTHERNGQVLQGYPVASYVGRHKKATETYQVCLDLIEFYNARVAVESNVKDFIEWVIRKGKSRLLFRRRELTAVTEMMPNSTIRDEIGVRMEGEFKKRALEKTVLYCEEPIADEFDLETGESKTIYGVSRIKDRRLLQEMLRWTPKLNTDSLVSFMLALLAAESYHNKHMVQSVRHGYEEPNKPSRLVKLPSQFSSRPMVQQKKLGSPFTKNK